MPDLQDDARPVERADRRTASGVHLGADRRRRHEERDQAEARRPVRAWRSSPSRRSRGSTCSRGCCRSSGSGVGAVALGWLAWRWSPRHAARAGRRRAAARPRARPPGGRRACSLRRLASCRSPSRSGSSRSSRRACSRSSRATCRRSPRSRRGASASRESRGGWCVASLPFVARVHDRLRPARGGGGGGRERPRSATQTEIAGFILIVIGLGFIGLLPWPERAVAPGLLRGRAGRASCSAPRSPSAPRRASARCSARSWRSPGARERSSRGVVLLAAYSLGLGAAFVLAGVAFTRAMGGSAGSATATG